MGSVTGAKEHLLTKGPISRVAAAPWPVFADDEIAAATEVLKSGKVNYWTGQQGREFEKEFAAFVGTQHAIAVANGTVALELALYALGIGSLDEVITTSRSFIASASCAVMRGATPICADVDRESGNITPETIRVVLSPRSKAIVVVHLAGWPCDMEPIMALANERGLKVIEDCAQAHGARYKGQPVGSIGHIAAFSFCQDKIMTTAGEGGMVVTDNADLWERAWSFKDHGKSWHRVYGQHQGAGFRWLHESFGTNWRLTEVQSAVGRVQLRKLNAWVLKRREFASIFNRRLSRLPALRVAIPDANAFHSYYKYYAYVRPEELRPGWDRNRIMEAVSAEGVPCFSGSCSEIYLEKAFEGLRTSSRWPVARELGETSLMFLVHPTLTSTEINRTCEVIEEVLSQATR